MKRSGFTLAEALIALAVVGIIAAAMLPLVSKYKPDTTKVLYLRTYDAISRTIAEFSSNEKMFPEITEEKDYIYTDYPFYNKGDVKLDNGKTVAEADNKICNLLALSAGAKSINCKPNEYKSYTSGGLEPSYKYKNGVEVLVSTLRTEPNSNNEAKYQTDIYFDVDGKDKGPNCLYNSVSCKKPDTFKLIVGADGSVVIGDAYGYEYRKKRHTWKKQEIIPGVIPEFDNKIIVKNFCDKYPNDLKCDPCQGKTSGSVFVDGKWTLCGPQEPPGPIQKPEIVPPTGPTPEPESDCPHPNKYTNEINGVNIYNTVCAINCEEQWGSFYHYMFIDSIGTFYCVNEECDQKQNVPNHVSPNSCRRYDPMEYNINMHGVLPAVYTKGMSLDPAYYWNGGGQDLGNQQIQTSPNF